MSVLVPSILVSISAGLDGFYGMMTQTLIPEGPSPWLSCRDCGCFICLPLELVKSNEILPNGLTGWALFLPASMVLQQPYHLKQRVNYSCQDSDFSSCLMSLVLRNLDSNHSLTVSGTSAVSPGGNVLLGNQIL